MPRRTNTQVSARVHVVCSVHGRITSCITVTPHGALWCITATHHSALWCIMVTPHSALWCITVIVMRYAFTLDVWCGNCFAIVLAVIIRLLVTVISNGYELKTAVLNRKRKCLWRGGLSSGEAASRSRSLSWDQERPGASAETRRDQEPQVGPGASGGTRSLSVFSQHVPRLAWG